MSEMAHAQPDGANSPAVSAPPVGLWNIANILTALRVLLVPVFAWILTLDGGMRPVWRLIATAIFLAAALTDKLDGYLARVRRLVTDFGKIADPIADKALTGVAMIILSAFGQLWWWVTVLILVREIGITLMRLAVVRRLVVPASKGGKTKTVLQIAAIIGLLLPFQAWNWTWASYVADVLMGLALALTLVTGADYVRRVVIGMRRSVASGNGKRGAEHPGTEAVSDIGDDGASLPGPGRDTDDGNECPGK